jgi:serine/threonine protein kinase
MPLIFIIISVYLLEFLSPFFLLDTEPDYKLPVFTQDPHLKDLLSSLLCKNPENRLADLSKVQNHPWFLGTNWSELRERKSDLRVPWVPPHTYNVAESSLNSADARDNAQKVIESARRVAQE